MYVGDRFWQTGIGIYAPVVSARSASAPARGVSPRTLASQDDDDLALDHLLSRVPLLTAALILLLIGVFYIEKRFALDMGPGDAMSLTTLIAFGASSYDRVVIEGEWWRAFLTPLLHLDWSHLIGNCVALALLGYYLETTVGRGWYGAIFFVSALTGVAGSLLGNPHALVTVGASGAITGLVGAVFVLSFHHSRDARAQAAMRRMSLRLAVPALGPLLWGAASNVDYHAHFGGALGGAAIGFGILVLWDGDSFRPGLSRTAAALATFGLLCAGVSASFAAAGMPHYAEVSAQAPTIRELRGAVKDIVNVGPDLAQRYPQDARAHFLAALGYVKDRQGVAAEEELRETIRLTSEPKLRPLNLAAKYYLAFVLAQRGLRREPAELAEEVCADPEADRRLRAQLKKVKLCD